VTDKILEFTGIQKSFGGVRVIDDVSFDVVRGSRSALIGPNGSGKTTTFNLISGVYEVDAGHVRVGGVDITSRPAHERVRFGLARSFQNIRLMPHLSPVENVMLGQYGRGKGWFSKLAPITSFPRSRRYEQALAALADAGLAEFRDRRVSDLPYGVQKRIEVVRALAARPELLLLDEPAAGLNPKETNDLRQLLERICESGVTLLVIEHDMGFVKNLCDHVVVLNFGRKIAEGTLDDVRKNTEVLEAYLGSEHEDA
jgi:branched-chain amino acid transport system ATP-binding protein